MSGVRVWKDIAEKICNISDKRCSLKHLSPHGLRHAFAKRLMDQGTDIRTVQELLGHKNVATTQIYTDVTREDMRKALQREAVGRARNVPKADGT